MTEPRSEPDTDDTITDDQAAHLLGDPSDDSAADTDDASDPDAGAEGNQEAARWRRRLRDTEAERDALKGRLEAVQRAEVERLAGSTLRDPSDLWNGVELSELLDDAGAVDAKIVAEKAEALAVQRPHYRAPQPMPVKRGQRVSGGGDPTDDHRSASWADVLGGRGR